MRVVPKVGLFVVSLLGAAGLLGCTTTADADHPLNRPSPAGEAGVGGGAPGAGGSSGGSSSSGAAGTGPAVGGSSSGGTAGVPPPGSSLVGRLSTAEVVVPAGVKAGVENWRIWGRGDLHVAPVYSVPLDNCGTLIGYTSGTQGSPSAHAVYLDPSDQLVRTLDLGPFECRGLAAEHDGHFAALLWDDAADAMFVQRFDLNGTPSFASMTELVNSDNKPDDFGLGESRLEYGDGRYGAYYHVHSDDGHEGDTLKWVGAQSGEESTEWDWGCSHSMSNVLRFNPALDDFMAGCVTDCFPGTEGDFSTGSIGGIYLNHRETKVIDVDAGCNGDVAGELGSAALGPSGYKLVFNAHQVPATPGQDSYDEATMNQDVGFSAIDADLESDGVVWLTTTTGIDEADASIARFSPDGSFEEQYVVGWSEPGDPMVYKLGLVRPDGSFVEPAVDVSGLARWGRRDDPFREHLNGDVIWAWFDDPDDTTLRVARVRAGGSSTTCANF